MHRPHAPAGGKPQFSKWLAHRCGGKSESAVALPSVARASTSHSTRPALTPASTIGDPVEQLRSCIVTLLLEAPRYGSVPQLLLATYTSVLKRVEDPAEGGERQAGSCRLHEDNFFETIAGETGMLGELRELQSANARLKKSLGTLQHQLDLLRIQLRERELDVARAERQQTAAEEAEAEHRAKLQAAQLQHTACHAELMQSKASQARLQQQLQQNQSIDETRIAERTADLRAELARLYDLVRAQEETIKSYDREVAALRADLEDLEANHTAANHELDAAQETVGHKDDEIVRLSNIIERKDETIAEFQRTVADLRLEAGHTRVLEAMIASDHAWRHVKDVFQSARALEVSTAHLPPPRAVKGRGNGPEVPLLLQHRQGARVVPRALSHADVTHIILSCIEEVAAGAVGALQGCTGVAPTLAPPLHWSVERHGPFAQQLRSWVLRRAGDKATLSAQILFGLHAVLERLRDSGDAELTLYSRIVEGHIPPTIALFVLHRLQWLLDACAAADHALYPEEPRGALPVTAMHRLLDEFSQHPSHALQPDEVMLLRFLLAMDFNAPFVPYTKLFCVDENGSMPFILRGLVDAVAARCVAYYDEVIAIVDRVVASGTQVSLAAFAAELLTCDPGRIVDIHLLQDGVRAELAAEPCGDAGGDVFDAALLKQWLQSRFLVRLAPAGDGAHSTSPSAFSLDRFREMPTDSSWRGLGDSQRLSRSFRLAKDNSATRALLGSLGRRNAGGLPFSFMQRQRTQSSANLRATASVVTM